MWGINDCGRFENEKVGNECPPEIKGCGAGSIYYQLESIEGYHDHEEAGKF